MNPSQFREARTARGAIYRWLVVAVLLVGVGAVLFLRQAENQTQDQKPGEVAAAGVPGLPRLLDLGADKCIPCKMMAPILQELRREFAGRFEVVFIDVWKEPDEAPRYGVRVIPTQIFFDAQGKELFRHQGFFSREDILKTWQAHGFDFDKEKAEPESS